MEEYVRVAHLNKTFIQGKRRVPVLQDLSFSIQKGEFVCLVGASGCGKSTVLRSIAGLDMDFSGTITVGGKAITGPSRERGVIFQEARLFPWLTVEENVAYSLQHMSKEQKKDCVQHHIDLVGLHGFESVYPRQLSGGMAQRANIARALVNNPKLLLLDEPFSALDTFTKINLQQAVYQIKESEHSTMLMVTHDIEEAVFLADTVIMLSPQFEGGKKIIPIPLPRPRDRNSVEFTKIKKQIFDDFFAQQQQAV
ncbi:ABC transporter ATP-binding protein [uncultured Megasphaera sp.]|uniref:ABC transporter ATP-binding protein n=1 Tax=uncultured Megasphaera sp. TaxID=165188 RepID=UPI0026582895|nr:ABC transporter ATP-binding protein [uncultured Megasphaera sp.]